MGLFDIFKKKKDTEFADRTTPNNRDETPNERKRVAGNFVDAVFHTFFPEGKYQQFFLTAKLKERLGNKYDEQTVALNYNLILTYIFVSPQKSKFSIVQQAYNRTDNILSEQELAFIYDFAWVNNIQPLIQKNNDNTPTRVKDDNIVTDEMPDGFGEFGLEVTNPIPIAGIPENKFYLARLQLENGDAITWNRIGSTRVDNIKYIIDNYVIYDKSGTEICHLYLCPYACRTSEKVPKGFLFRCD